LKFTLLAFRNSFAHEDMDRARSATGASKNKNSAEFYVVIHTLMRERISECK